MKTHRKPLVTTKIHEETISAECAIGLPGKLSQGLALVKMCQGLRYVKADKRMPNRSPWNCLTPTIGKVMRRRLNQFECGA